MAPSGKFAGGAFSLAMAAANTQTLVRRVETGRFGGLRYDIRAGENRSAGDTARAKMSADDLDKRFPEDTAMQFNYLPSINAKLARSRKDATNWAI